MKKVIVFICASLLATAVYAGCVTHTYFVNGKMIICTTCCTGGNCTTTCI